MISQKSMESMFEVDRLWDSRHHKIKANIYGKSTIVPLGKPDIARAKGSNLLTHNALEIAVAQFELKGSDLIEVLAALLMTNHQAGSGLTHDHKSYESIQPGGFIAEDYHHPRQIVRDTVKTGLSTVAELIGRDPKYFEIEEIGTPTTLLPSIYYVIDMLGYSDHAPSSFMITEEGRLKTKRSNKIILKNITPIKHK